MNFLVRQLSVRIQGLEFFHECVHHHRHYHHHLQVVVMVVVTVAAVAAAAAAAAVAAALVAVAVAVVHRNMKRKLFTFYSGFGHYSLSLLLSAFVISFLTRFVPLLRPSLFVRFFDHSYDSVSAGLELGSAEEKASSLTT